MRRLALTIALCAGCWLAAGAQSTFTEQLQQSKAGEGKVTVTQDKAIDQLVNTPTTTTAPTNKTTTTTTTTTPAKPQQNGKQADDLLTDTSVATDSIDRSKKIMKGERLSRTGLCRR